MSVTVEKTGKQWNVRLWDSSGAGRVVWTFKAEVDARRLAMNIQDALDKPA